MKKIAIFIFLISLSLQVKATLRVMATTSDVGALVKVVGGKFVDVFSVAKGTQDPHHIEAKPSFMVKFHHANLVVAQGLELENAWLRPLIDGSRNPDIRIGTNGYMELGQDLNPLEIPSSTTVTRAQGDVHPGGNPHFQLDPIRMGKAAILVADRLSTFDPSHSTLFISNAKAFQKKMEKKTIEWQKRIAKTGIKEIITHHKSFTYFCHRFHLKCNLQLEPKPGIPPTASHLIYVIDSMKARHLHVVFIENYFDDDSIDKIKSAIPKLFSKKIPISVGGEDDVKSLSSLYEKLVSTLEQAVH